MAARRWAISGGDAGMTAKPPVASAAPDVAAPDATAFAEAHRRLLADSSIQFDMQPVEPPPRPQVDSALADFIAAIWPVVQVLFWVGVAALVLFLVYSLVMHLSGAEPPWRSKSSATVDESWRPQEAPARALLSEADALAARGLYSEAAHLLLFRSIEDIDARKPELVRPALTSRDIAALPAIPDRPRGAFARIAMLVERSLFARRPLTEPDWREARASYEDFAFAEGWRG